MTPNFSPIAQLIYLATPSVCREHSQSCGKLICQGQTYDPSIVRFNRIVERISLGMEYWSAFLKVRYTYEES
jgi:hypothetical protein